MMEDSRTKGLPWHLLLPAVSLIVAVLLVVLATFAHSAFRDREALALDGRILGIAQAVELDLRERGVGAADAILEEALAQAGTDVRGLALESANGEATTEAGNQDADLSVRRVDLFIGPQGAPRGHGVPGTPGPRGRHGRRTLVIRLDPDAGGAPLSVRALPVGAAVVGLALLAFAFLGGRLLVRQRREAVAEARSHRLEALGLAGAGLAHQLRNPLATIKGSCQLLEERLTDPALAERVRATVVQADRMDRMLGSLLDFARPPQPEVKDTPLGPALYEIERRHPRTRVVQGENLLVRVDPEHLLQILENVVANACALSAEDAQVELSAVCVGGCVELRVADRGPGPGEDPERLFQPYTTTRADGTGLGLPIARALAEANGGALQLLARPGGGSIAVLTLSLGEVAP